MPVACVLSVEPTQKSLLLLVGIVVCYANSVAKSGLKDERREASIEAKKQTVSPTRRRSLLPACPVASSPHAGLLFCCPEGVFQKSFPRGNSGGVPRRDFPRGKVRPGFGKVPSETAKGSVPRRDPVARVACPGGNRLRTRTAHSAEQSYNWWMIKTTMVLFLIETGATVGAGTTDG